ncbi:MAG: DUF507 family protein [Bdellovibrio sp.]
MNLSPDRQNLWAHLVTDQIWHDDLVDYTDEDLALRIAKKAIAELVQEEESMAAKVREKLSSLKRGLIEHSPEWEVLFQKYMKEERAKKAHP